MPQVPRAKAAPLAAARRDLLLLQAVTDSLTRLEQQRFSVATHKQVVYQLNPAGPTSLGRPVADLAVGRLELERGSYQCLILKTAHALGVFEAGEILHCAAATACQGFSTLGVLGKSNGYSH